MFGRRRSREIAPDEIFLDSSNLPSLDSAQMEGRVESPVSPTPLVGVGMVFALGVCAFLYQTFSLQIVQGAEFSEISRENRLDRSILFAPRGHIYDRTGEQIAWNEALTAEEELASTTPREVTDFPRRRYYEQDGLAHILGFVRYPRQDQSGVWWREDYSGVSGAELLFDTELRGSNGSSLLETDARGGIRRQHIVVPTQIGKDITLTIDAAVQSKLHTQLAQHAENNNFKGGAAVIIDVHSGELLALTSFPEYDNEAFTEGNTAAVTAAHESARTPLLNRAIAGLYAPGSIVKPLFAAAALQESIIAPEKSILSTGQLTVPNPYNPDKPSVFRDWKAHGWVDMRRAIAVSSDVYFYTIGGGVPGQKGLGITKLDDYSRAFGLGSLTGIALKGEVEGVIPTPEWKKQVFGEDEEWRLGDTYITSIGQFGFQITPIQAARFTAALANGGKLLTPHIIPGELQEIAVGIDDEYLQVAREGMHSAVADGGTAAALNIAGIEIAAKTGTAEVGERNQFMNSWVVGFWPAAEPRYAFAVVLEKAPAGTLSGASPGLRPFFEWLITEKPEYVGKEEDLTPDEGGVPSE